MKYFLYCLILGVFCFGCATKPVYQKGLLGHSNFRRVVVLGEHIQPAQAHYYQQYYQAFVWYIPSQGWMSDATQKMRHAFVMSRGMKKLIAELESLSYTIGEWTIYIPVQAQPYFLSALKKMTEDSIRGSKGNIVLINGDENVAMENEVWRVFGNTFKVSYQKDQ